MLSVIIRQMLVCVCFFRALNLLQFVFLYLFLFLCGSRYLGDGDTHRCEVLIDGAAIIQTCLLPFW